LHAINLRFNVHMVWLSSKQLAKAFHLYGYVLMQRRLTTCTRQDNKAVQQNTRTHANK